MWTAMREPSVGHLAIHQGGEKDDIFFRDFTIDIFLSVLSPNVHIMDLKNFIFRPKLLTHKSAPSFYVSIRLVHKRLDLLSEVLIGRNNFLIFLLCLCHHSGGISIMLLKES